MYVLIKKYESIRNNRFIVGFFFFMDKGDVTHFGLFFLNECVFMGLETCLVLSDDERATVVIVLEVENDLFVFRYFY